MKWLPPVVLEEPLLTTYYGYDSADNSICLECGHARESHFSCSIGSFCEECPTNDNVWEHVWVSPGNPRDKLVWYDQMVANFAPKYVCVVKGEHAREDVLRKLNDRVAEARSLDQLQKG